MTVAHEEEWALDDGQDTPDPIEGKEPIEGQEAPAPSEIDKLAAEMGWKPKAEWKGDQSTWTPADQYIRNTFTKQQSGVERIRDTTRQARAAQRAAEEAQTRLEKLERTTNELMSVQERRHRAELENYFEQAKKEAAAAKDDDLYYDLVEQKAKAVEVLDNQFKREPEVNYTAQAQQMLDDPVVGRFLRKNPWVVQDEEAYAFAFAVAGDLAEAGYPKSLQIREVEKALREEYPDRYTRQSGAQQRPAAAAQEEGAEEFELPNFEPDPVDTSHRVRDPITGQFVPEKEAHLYQQQRPAPQQQQLPQRRAPAPVQSGNRLPNAARMNDDQKAWASLPDEARRIYTEQKKSGAIKMDLKTYAKLYNNEPVDVL